MSSCQWTVWHLCSRCSTVCACCLSTVAPFSIPSCVICMSFCSGHFVVNRLMIDWYRRQLPVHVGSYIARVRRTSGPVCGQLQQESAQFHRPVLRRFTRTRPRRSTTAHWRHWAGASNITPIRGVLAAAGGSIYPTSALKFRPSEKCRKIIFLSESFRLKCEILDRKTPFWRN